MGDTDTRYHCIKCQSPKLVYIESLIGTVKLADTDLTPRRSRAHWSVTCQECGHEIKDKEQRKAIDSMLFHASESGRKEEQVRRAAPDMLKALRAVRVLFAPRPGLPVDIEASFRRMMLNCPELKQVNESIEKADTPA